jgi:DNA-binding YbaB/EbfC family protein
MFKEIGQLAGLLKQLPKLREEMEKFQQRLDQISAEGTAGAGMVKARVSGRLELVKLEIGDEAMKSGDREMLEDLVRGAVNQAMEKARQQAAQETAKLSASLDLPTGLNLPGLQLPGT